jgi:hypothetical protein
MRPNAKANHLVTVPPCTIGIANRPGANAAVLMKTKKRTPRIVSKIRPRLAALKVDVSGDEDAICWNPGETQPKMKIRIAVYTKARLRREQLR